MTLTNKENYTILIIFLIKINKLLLIKFYTHNNIDVVIFMKVQNLYNIMFDAASLSCHYNRTLQYLV